MRSLILTAVTTTGINLLSSVFMIQKQIDKKTKIEGYILTIDAPNRETFTLALPKKSVQDIIDVLQGEIDETK